MERRHVAAALAGLVLVGGAVVLLRVTGQTQSQPGLPQIPPPPTSLRGYTAQGVLVPSASAPPAPPGRLQVTPGPHRLQVRWASAITGGHEPAGAAGYDVHWGSGGKLNHERLVAEPDIELDGLADNAPTTVEVQTVDSFGQRSRPSTASGRPRRDTGQYTFVDHFDGPVVPDPRLWRLSSQDACSSAGRESGADDQLRITDTCQDAQVTLRARTPFRLNTSGTNGVLGVFSIDTDAPGENGELDLDLVPGPVDVLDESAPGPPPQPAPWLALDDPDLPVGTIRVEINTTVGPAATWVQVLVAPGTPRIKPVSAGLAPVPAAVTGMSVRWDVVLRTDGIQVLRDGVEVAAGNVVPAWTSATALVGFGGPLVGQLNAGVNLIGFTGAPTSAPPLLAPPPVSADAAALNIDTPTTPAPRGLPAITGTTGGQLRFTVLPVAGSPQLPVWNGTGPPPSFTVEVDGQRFPAQPAIPGTPLLSAVRYPMVARLPADVLVPQSGSLPVTVLTNLPDGGSASFEVVAADLELTLAPGAAPTVPKASPPNPPPAPQLAEPTVTLLDAGGRPMPANQELPPGRVVVNIVLDGPAGQRLNGRIGGLAGFEVWLDGTKLATVPTTLDGPGIAGQWQIALDTGIMTPGQHSIDVHEFSTEASVQDVSSGVAFTLKAA